MQPVIVDVDTGVDDALALAVTLAQPERRLIAVTTVAGNVDVGQATRNTRLVLDWLGARSIPVAKGAASPLLRKHRDARAYHGPDGLGGAVLPVERSGPILDTSAPEVIVRAARRYAGKLCLVCLAPLTNLAIALRLEPDLPFLIDRVIVMGGAFAVAGNVTPAAEFNVWSDPEAASLVAQAGFRIRWVGLDVTELVRLERSRWERLGNATDPRSILAREVGRWAFEQRGLTSFALHDPLAVVAAVREEFIDWAPGHVIVRTETDEVAGKTVYQSDPDGRARVAHRVNSDGAQAFLERALGLVGEGMTWPSSDAP